jgi:hypothetical protein
MYNTSLTFGVLYCMEKAAEIDRIWQDERRVVFLFSFFVLMYYVALFLNTHPEFVMRLFEAKGVYY